MAAPVFYGLAVSEAYRYLSVRPLQTEVSSRVCAGLLDFGVEAAACDYDTDIFPLYCLGGGRLQSTPLSVLTPKQMHINC